MFLSLFCQTVHSQLLVVQDEGYDLLANELQEGEVPAEETGEDALHVGEGVNAGAVNGVDGDQEMANGEETTAGTGITGEQQPNKVRVTTPYLTKYERARILGTRALQIRLLHYPALRTCLT